MRARVLVGSILLAVVAAACGTTDEPVDLVVVGDGREEAPEPAGGDRLARAASTTAGSSFRWSVEGGFDDEALDELGADDDAELSLDAITAMSGFGSIAGEGEVDAEGDVAMTMDVGFAAVEQRTVGGDVFVRSDLVVEGQWVVVDETELPDGTSVSAEQQADGAAMLVALEQMGGELEDLGTEEVDGVTVTHLRSTTRFDEAAADEIEALGSEAGDPEGMDDAFSVLGELMGEIVVDVYVDADDHVRRLEQQTGPTQITVDYFDFGADVEVEAPADAVPFSQLDPQQLQEDAQAAMEEQMAEVVGGLQESFAPFDDLNQALEEGDAQGFLAARDAICADELFAPEAQTELCDMTFEQAQEQYAAEIAAEDGG